jgi:hypothetical protein
LLTEFNLCDPAAQGFSPFGYCGNNPVIRIDRNGKFFWLVAAAVIGATINVATNWDNIENVGDFLSYAGIGATSGALATLGPLGWAGAGVLTGAGNTALQGGNIGQIAFNGFVGGISGLAGGYAGQWASSFATNLAVGASPIIRGQSRVLLVVVLVDLLGDLLAVLSKLEI